MNSRRNFLTHGFVLGAMGLAGKAIADSCDFRLTPRQALGPFYPVEFPADSDVDLTQIKGSNRRATGQVMIVEGVVTDEFCRPIEGAVVEIWQACHTGRYNHPSDTSTNKLDPHFQYYGVMKTDAQGRYRFKTIKPGHYAASDTWMRPPHIHYKVTLRGYKELVTQMYWGDEDLNNQDRILMAIPAAERSKVVVPFASVVVDGERVGRGQFDITLAKIP